MEITQSGQEPVQLKFPICVIQQLMRTLPHVDAAVQLGQESGPSSLMAYPLLAWKVQGVEGDVQEEAGSVVLQLRNDRFVDTSLDLDLETAIALQRDLSLAIAHAQSLSLAPRSTASRQN